MNATLSPLLPIWLSFRLRNRTRNSISQSRPLVARIDVSASHRDVMTVVVVGCGGGLDVVRFKQIVPPAAKAPRLAPSLGAYFLSLTQT